jgi:hypothetical protein
MGINVKSGRTGLANLNAFWASGHDLKLGIARASPRTGRLQPGGISAQDFPRMRAQQLCSGGVARKSIRKHQARSSEGTHRLGNGAASKPKTARTIHQAEIVASTTCEIMIFLSTGLLFGH